MIRRSGQTEFADGRPGLSCRCGACWSGELVQPMTWLGCQTAIPLPAPPLVAAPPDARQRHRLVGRALPESHWNIGTSGLSHQACQRIPYHSDVVERQQHTADEQSRSGRPFPSCPAILPVKKRMGFPLLCTVVRRRLVIRWGGGPTRRVSGAHRQGPVPRRQCHVKGTNFTFRAGGSIRRHCKRWSPCRTVNSRAGSRSTPRRSRRRL